VGRVTILEGVDGGPRKYDWGDESKRVPVDAYVCISHDAIDFIASQSAGAENRNISSELILEFAVHKVPSASALKNDASLQMLDLTKDRTYPVLSIYCGSATRDKEWPRRIPQPDRSAFRTSPHCQISMRLVETRGDIDFKNGTVKELSATFCAYDHAIRGTVVEVHWEEYNRDDLTEDYPDLADIGSFNARALDEHTPGASSCFLYLHLRYTRGDARALLLPLILTPPPDLQVVLQATLLADKDTLWKKPEGTRRKGRRLLL